MKTYYIDLHQTKIT